MLRNPFAVEKRASHAVDCGAAHMAWWRMTRKRPRRGSRHKKQRRWPKILGIVVLGFFEAGSMAGSHMIKIWIVANAALAGIGAAAALAHPLTIASAVVASPITSLNPMIAAGWVSGLVEAFLGKPRVIDFENLTEDLSSLRGFWKNKITKILLVTVFTNFGSALGTFVAIPLMLKVFT